MIMREMGAPARVTSPAKRATTAGEEVVDADMTDWPRMAVLLHAHATRWLDSIFVVIVNGAILACAVVAGLVGYLVIGPLANVLFPTLATTFRIPDPAANAQIVLPTEKLRVYPSALSASAPRFFSTFADKWQKDQAFSVNAIEDALCRVPVTDAEKKTRPPFSISAAKLLMHLSALVYEAPEVIGHFAKQYGFNLETVAGNGASVNIFYSVELRVVILVFRGSNPLVLSEFLTSAMIQSMKADRNALPGAVHEAYLNLLSFPNSVKEDEVESGANTAGKFKIVSEALQRNAPKPFATPGLSIEGILQTLETVIFPKFEEHALQEHKRLQNVHSDLRTANGRPVEVQMKQPGPFIWFTGHSTGACLASLVLGHLVHTTNPVVSAGLIKGCYTFGSPKCGNTEFATSMARSCTANQIVMYRVVNANDIVPAFPLGSSQSTQPYSKSSDDIASHLSSSLRVLHRESDYKHVGVPVVLHYDSATGYTVGGVRDWECIVKNLLWFVGVRVPAAVGRWLTGKGSIVGLFQIGWPFPWEHLPVEYEKRLKA